MKDIRQRTVGGVAWSVFEACSTQALAFFAFLVLARLLGPADFGLLALANVYVCIAQWLIYQGFGEAIVQFKKVDDDLLNSAFWTINAIAAGLVAITLFLARPVAIWFGDERLSFILKALSPVLIISSLISIPHALLEREIAFRAIARRTFLSYLTGGIVGVSMAFAGFGFWSLVGQQLAGGVCNVVTLWSTCHWRPRLRFSLDSLRMLVRFGTSICAIQLVAQVGRRADQIFIGKFLGIVASGVFAIGARISAMANEILVASVAKVSLSALSRIQDDETRSLNGFYRIAQIQSCLTLPLFLGASLLSPEIVSVCLGSKWLGSVPIVRILLLTGPFDVFSWIIGATIIARGKPHRSLVLSSIHAVVNVALVAVVVRWGLLAVAVAYVLRAIVALPVDFFFLKAVLPVKMARVFRLLAPLALAAAVMCGVVEMVRSNLDGHAPLAVVAVAGIAAGAISYISMLALVQRELLREIFNHWKEFMARSPEAVSEAAVGDDLLVP